MKFTIGMAVHNDFDGVYFTIQALRMYHDIQDAEIIVVDNAPSTPAGATIKAFIEGWVPKGRYIAAADIEGTAAPRNRVFAEAKGEWVMCLDSHVLLMEGALNYLDHFTQQYPDSSDLLSGPMWYDNLQQCSTHFDNQWRSEMWGTWATDPRGVDPSLPPFEIPAMGLGLFACRKDAWLNFHSEFRGFGGEEWYIHEKFRKAGHKCLCLPGLRWVHRFGRPNGVSYRLTRFDKARNYYLGHIELGLDTKPIYDHFVGGRLITEQHWQGIMRGAKTEQEAVGIITASAPTAKPVSSGCGGCSAPPKPSIDIWYQMASQQPSDINEHLPTLRELASRCDTVVECGVRRGTSTVALLAGKPKRLLSVDTVRSAEVSQLAEVVDDVAFEFRQSDSRAVEVPEADMVFIDTIHRADHLWAELTHLAPKCRRWIVLHDTVTYGEHGEGGGPGLLPAVRRFVREHPEWTVVRHDHNNHGLMVLSKHPEDKKPLPGLVRQGWNLGKALVRLAVNGQDPLPLPIVESRLATCDLCPSRVEDRCSECGCYLHERPDGGTGKAHWPTEDCPLGKWEVRR